jgi:BirA family biotin operon repressor/biotin-[acetyl-CoA-carboxylase] ligase
VTHVGRPVFVFDEVDSTQTVARALPPGSAVIADRQSAGRGQYGRTWTSRPGASLLLSVVLDPPPELRRAVVLTAWAAVAVGDSIRQLVGWTPRIKWPNDLLLNGRKVCGVLIEQGTTVVGGIGLNVNQTAEQFAEDGLPDATSLAVVTGSPIPVRDVAKTVLRSLDEWYDRLLAGDWSTLEAAWRAGTGLVGRPVIAELADGTAVPGRVWDMGFDGIELDAGAGAVRVLVPEHVRQLRAV